MTTLCNLTPADLTKAGIFNQARAFAYHSGQARIAAAASFRLAAVCLAETARRARARKDSRTAATTMARALAQITAAQSLEK